MSWRRPTLAFLLAPLTVPPVVIVLRACTDGLDTAHGFLGVLDDIIGGFEASSRIAVNAGPHDVVRHGTKVVDVRSCFHEQKAAGLRQMRP